MYLFSDSYNEGTKKLQTIKNGDNCIFTADSDYEPVEKATYVSNKFKESQKQSNLPDLPRVEEIV